MSKRLLTVSLAIAVASALIFIPLTAGGQEGRSDGAKQGPAVGGAAAGGTVDQGTWDGDGPAPRDQVILDDLIVDGSACVGLDCVNGESFGFDTIRLKENNIRIKAQDTSTSASFPSADWQITFNDSSNGGQNKFAIDNITDPGGQTPFTIEAGANSHALYVDDAERIGLSTSNPVVELHIVDGDTPTIRLEQDGSSGFTAQTWDLAGNEANFFIRDVSNGSRLSFKIIPGAPSDSLTIGADGTVRMGTNSGTGNSLILDPSDNNILPQVKMIATTQGADWEIGVTSLSEFKISDTNQGSVQFKVTDENSIRINPQNTAPTTPQNGEIYYDNTAPGALCAYVNGAWVVAAGTGTCA